MVNYDDNNRKGWDIIPGSEKIRELYGLEREDKYEWAKQVEELLDVLCYSGPDHKIEVKYETIILVKRHGGNVYVEWLSKYKGKDFYEPSGYQTSDANYFHHGYKDEDGNLLDIPHIGFTYDLLMRTIRKYGLEPIRSSQATENGDYTVAYRVPEYLLLRERIMTWPLEAFDLLKEWKLEDIKLEKEREKKRLQEIYKNKGK